MRMGDGSPPNRGEDGPARAVPIRDYAAAGCQIAPAGSWPDAPAEAIILGLKDLPADGTPLGHRHIMFGHAFKGQPGGPPPFCKGSAPAAAPCWSWNT
jgi:hypothetical protein